MGELPGLYELPEKEATGLSRFLKGSFWGRRKEVHPRKVVLFFLVKELVLGRFCLDFSFVGVVLMAEVQWILWRKAENSHFCKKNTKKTTHPT